MNIRREADVSALIQKNWRWVTVSTYGDRGTVLSKHRTYEAASKAARGTSRTIVEITDYVWWQF